MKPSSPCLDCKNRKPGCHSECEKYKDFRDNLADFKESIRPDEIAEYSKIRSGRIKKIKSSY